MDDRWESDDSISQFSNASQSGFDSNGGQTSGDDDEFDIQCDLLQSTLQRCRDDIYHVDQDDVDSQHCDQSPMSRETESPSGSSLDDMCMDGDLQLLEDNICHRDSTGLSLMTVQNELSEDQVRAVKAALKLNRQYQEVLEREVHRLDDHIWNLENRRARLAKQLQTNNERQIWSIPNCFPFFQDRLGRGPPPSEISEQVNNAGVLIRLPDMCRKFLPEQQVMFVGNVAQILRMNVEKEFTTRLRRLHMEHDMGEENDVQLSVVLEEIDNIRTSSRDVLLKNYSEYYQLIDWVDVANRQNKDLTEGLMTPEACKAMWYNVFLPTINRSNWTVSETASLLNLVKNNPKMSWPEIANRLGTRRSGYLCLKRYAEKEPIKTDSHLSEADLNLVHALVQKHSLANFTVWSNVAYEFQKVARNVMAVSYLANQPGMYQQNWTSSEIQKLVEVVKSQGFGYINWEIVAKQMPNRTATQCIGKYSAVFKAELSKVSFIQSLADIWDATVELKEYPLARTRPNNASFWYTRNQMNAIRDCERNEMVYKWIHAQRREIREFLLAYYRSPNFKGPHITPRGNVIFLQPIIKVSPDSLPTLTSAVARDVMHTLILAGNRGLHVMLPSLTSFIRMLRENNEVNDVLKKIVDYSRTVDAAERRQSLCQLQRIIGEGRNYGCADEHVHCLAGICYMREAFPVEVVVTDSVADMITAVLLADDWRRTEPSAEFCSAEDIISATCKLHFRLVMGDLAWNKALTLSDMDAMSLRIVRDEVDRSDMLKNDLMVIMATYTVSSTSSAHLCSKSHIATCKVNGRATFQLTSRDGYRHMTCPVCCRHPTWHHKNTSVTMDRHVTEMKELVEMSPDNLFVETGVYNALNGMLKQMRYIPINDPSKKLYDFHVNKAVVITMKSIMQAICIGRMAKNFKNRTYRQHFGKRYFPKPFSQTISNRADKSIELIRQVTEYMNPPGQETHVGTRTTRVILMILYQITDGISRKVQYEERVIMRATVSSSSDVEQPNMEPTRRSNRTQLDGSFKSIFDATVKDIEKGLPKPSYKRKPRKLRGRPTRAMIGTLSSLVRELPKRQPPKKKIIRKPMGRKLNALAKINTEADVSCFAKTAQFLKMDKAKIQQSMEKLPQRLLRKDESLVNQLSLWLLEMYDKVPDEDIRKEFTSDESFLQMSTRLVRTLLDETVCSVDMLQCFIRSWAAPRRSWYTDGNKLVVTKTGRHCTRFSTGQIEAFTSVIKNKYISPEIPKNISLDDYSILRERMRSLMRPAMEAMIQKQIESEQCENEDSVDDDTRVVLNKFIKAKTFFASVSSIVENQR